jgi:hypothetical protein
MDTNIMKIIYISSEWSCNKTSRCPYRAFGRHLRVQWIGRLVVSQMCYSVTLCQKVKTNYQKVGQKEKKLSRNCQKRKKSCQKVVKKFSKSCQKVVKKLPKVVKKLSKSCQQIVIVFHNSVLSMRFHSWLRRLHTTDFQWCQEGGRVGQKVLSKPSADSFAVGRRQKGLRRLPRLEV